MLDTDPVPRTTIHRFAPWLDWIVVEFDVDDLGVNGRSENGLNDHEPNADRKTDIDEVFATAVEVLQQSSIYQQVDLLTIRGISREREALERIGATWLPHQFVQSGTDFVSAINHARRSFDSERSDQTFTRYPDPIPFSLHRLLRRLLHPFTLGVLICTLSVFLFENTLVRAYYPPGSTIRARFDVGIPIVFLCNRVGPS